MRTYRQIERQEAVVVVSAVSCDRCGESARVKGAGLDRVAWGAVESLIQGSGQNLVQLDLCRNCTDAVIEFIRAHPRAKLQTTADRLAAMSEATS